MSLPSTRIPAFCGIPVSQEDLALITEMVTDFGLPRSEIANTVCELLEWQRPNGKLGRVQISGNFPPAPIQGARGIGTA